MNDCLVCLGAPGDEALARVHVWSDQTWRLSTSIAAPIVGFSYLEPRRHVPHITDLDGVEAETLGPVLGRVTRALRELTAAELIYVTVFGERIAHLHFNLAPHRPGDPLRGGPALIEPGAPPASVDAQRELAGRLQAALGG